MKKETTIEQALKDASEQRNGKSWQREQKRLRKEKNTNGNRRCI